MMCANRQQKGISLRSFLNRLILVCVLPLLILMGWLVFDTIQTGHNQLDQQSRTLAKNFSNEVDQFLSARLKGLNILAQSPLIDNQAHWPELYREAQGYYSSFNSHVLLSSIDMPLRMLMNTRVAYGSQLPLMPVPQGRAAASEALATGQPAVGDVFMGPVAKEPLVALAVPVIRQEQIKVLLLTVLETKLLQTMLEKFNPPEGLALALHDSSGRQIASLGSFESENKLFFHSFDKISIQSDLSHWSTVAVVTPELHKRYFLRSVLSVLLGLVAAAAVSLLAAFLASRRLTDEVASLTDTKTEEHTSAGIYEIQAVQAIIAEASAGLRRSEEHFRRLFDHSPLPMFFADTQEDVLATNARFCEKFGYTADDIGNLSSWWRLTSLDKNGAILAESQWKKALNQAILDNSDIRAGEFLMKGRDGSPRTMQISGTILREGILATFIDRTERNAEEERLKIWAELFENAQLGLAIADAKTNIFTTVNAAFAKERGYTQEELVGQPVMTVFPEHLLADLHKNIIKAHEDGHITFESEHRAKDGSTFPVLVDITVVRDAEGNPATRVVYVLNLSQRKQAEKELRDLQDLALEQQKMARLAALNQMQDANIARTSAEDALAALRMSEERYRLLSENSGDVIWLYDLVNDCFDYISPSVKKLRGYSLEEVMHQKMQDALTPDSYHAVANSLPMRLASFAAGDESVRSQVHEVDQPCKDGSIVPTEVVTTLITDAEGKVTHIQGVTRNIQERRQLEDERKRLQSQLIQAQKMEAIGTLAGGIAHDFNNILGAIIGYAEMARETVPANSDIANDLDKVLEAGERASSLVKQILAFSRQTKAEHIALSPVYLVKEAIKLLRPALPSTIAIIQHLDSQTDAILADPTQIHQIVMNLCTNAFHAMEQQGGELEISLSQEDLNDTELLAQHNVRSGKFVRLMIRDSGCGIPPAIREKIFEPYFTTKEIGKGTGMGLAIIHGIVTGLGGFITCSSEVEKGSEFNVYFPAIRKEESAQPVSKEGIPTGKGRILYIDDEEILANLGQAMLERLGYEVTVRSSSIEALSTFQNQPETFDAVITDQTMPGMTGIDLAKRMLQIRPGLPIILCTGYSANISEERVQAVGIQALIFKPMSKKDIALQLNRLLQKTSAADLDMSC